MALFAVLSETIVSFVGILMVMEITEMFTTLGQIKLEIACTF